MLRGVQLAADKVNEAGGIDGHPLKLIVEDSEYRPQAGLDAATKLFDVDKVDAAVVFGGSSITIPIAEMAAPKGKIIMNTSASSSKLGELCGHRVQHAAARRHRRQGARRICRRARA